MEYLIDLNASAAARRAGYSEETAYSTGWENLRKPEIQDRIKELRDTMAKGFNITRERIIEEYRRIAYFDIRQIHTIDGAIKPIQDLDEESAAAVAGIEVYEEKVPSDDENENITVGQVKKIKIADKVKALDALCRIFGYNAPDKHAFTDPDGNPVTIFQLPDNGRGKVETK